jgi:hypothetical protein
MIVKNTIILRRKKAKAMILLLKINENLSK